MALNLHTHKLFLEYFFQVESVVAPWKIDVYLYERTEWDI